MSCVFIWQEEPGTSPGVLMISQALELIPLLVQYVSLQILTISTSPEIFFTHWIFLHTGSGRYIPGSGPNPSGPVGVADPFTGESLMIHLWQLFSDRPMYFRWYKAVLFCFYVESNTNWIIPVSAVQEEAPTPRQPSDRRLPTSTSPKLTVWPLSKPTARRSLVSITWSHADQVIITLDYVKILNWSKQKERSFPSSKSLHDMHVYFTEAIQKTPHF